MAGYFRGTRGGTGGLPGMIDAPVPWLWPVMRPAASRCWLEKPPVPVCVEVLPVSRPEESRNWVCRLWEDEGACVWAVPVSRPEASRNWVDCVCDALRLCAVPVNLPLASRYCVVALFPDCGRVTDVPIRRPLASRTVLEMVPFACSLRSMVWVILPLPSRTTSRLDCAKAPAPREKTTKTKVCHGFMWIYDVESHAFIQRGGKNPWGCRILCVAVDLVLRDGVGCGTVGAADGTYGTQSKYRSKPDISRHGDLHGCAGDWLYLCGVSIGGSAECALALVGLAGNSGDHPPSGCGS